LSVPTIDHLVKNIIKMHGIFYDSAIHQVALFPAITGDLVLIQALHTQERSYKMNAPSRVLI